MTEIIHRPQKSPRLGARSKLPRHMKANTQGNENDDWVLWLRKVTISGSEIENAPESIKNDRQVVLEAVTQRGVALRSVSENLRDDKTIVMEAVKNQGHALEYASERLKRDIEVGLEAVKQNWFAIRYISKEVLNDNEIVFEAVKQDGRALKYASQDLRTDKEFIMSLAKINGNVLECLPTNLEGDVDIIRTCLAQNEDSSRFIAEHVRNDIMKTNMIYASPKSRIKRQLSIIAEEKADDIDIQELLEEIRTEGRNLGYAPSELKNERDFVLKAVKTNPRALQFAPTESKEDKEVVLAAVCLDGLTLQYASETLKSDREIVKVATGQDAGAFAFASDELKDDTNFALTIVTQTDLAMEYTTPDQKVDSSFLDEVGKKNPNAVAFVSSSQRKRRASVVEELKLKELAQNDSQVDSMPNFEKSTALTRKPWMPECVPLIIGVPSSESDSSKATRKNLALMLSKSEQELKRQKDIKKQLYLSVQKLAETLQNAGVNPEKIPTKAFSENPEISCVTSDDISDLETVQIKNEGRVSNTKSQSKSKVDVQSLVPCIILLLVIALIVLVLTSIFLFQDYPYCTLCEDGSQPLDRNSCVPYSEAATIKSGSSECKAYQATFGNSCGCENSLTPVGFCRICENDDIPLDPFADVFGFSCVEFEFDANSDDPIFDSCEAYQDFAGTKCCSSIVPTTAPSFETVSSEGPCDTGLLLLTVNIIVNSNADDTTWRVIDKRSGNTMLQGGPYPLDGTTDQKETCVALDSCTKFAVYSRSSKEVFAKDVLSYDVNLFGSRVAEGSYYGVGTAIHDIGDCSPTG